MTSSVILDDVDDYLAPSQACINPAFQPREAEANANANANKEDEKKDDDQSEMKETTAVVIPRRRRRRPAANNGNNNSNSNSLAIPQAPNPNKKAGDAVKASMADCLACSGCVTTAETVLMEQRHSLTSLKNQLPLQQGNHRALLISPASMADLCRHLQLMNNDHDHDHLTTQRQLTTLFHQVLHVSLVIDGNVPLMWSLQAQAEEFCRLYKQGRNKNYNLPTPAPSTPIDATHTMVYTSDGDGDGGTKIVTASDDDHDDHHHPLFQNQVPVVSGSCPAVVCLVEKSKPDVVTHLSATTSPMSLMGGVLKSQKNNKYTEFWSIMPCHDKKLEASRPDFLQPPTTDNETAATTTTTTPKQQQQHLVDLVITTQECVQLLQEWLGETTTTTTTTTIASVEEVTAYVQQLPLSQVGMDDDDLLLLVASTCSSSTDNNSNNNSNDHEQPPMWATVSHSHAHHHQSINNNNNNKNDTNDNTTNNNNNNNNNNTSINPYVSGGHADYIFTYAAKTLFGVSLETVPWKAVLAGSSNNNKTRIIKSARLAKRSKDYYQAVLYQNERDGSYTTQIPATTTTTIDDNNNNNNNHFTPVLTFAMAYGMQTLQRVLDASTLASSNKNHLDYVEAMACPSGCVNGGGQNKVLPSSSHDNDNNVNVNNHASSRETPTHTRQRVGQTQQQLQVVDDQYVNNNNKTAGLPMISSSSKTTRYHVVPPMQYAMGAAAGVAVQELQW